jgi:ethanolamine ammonia-lyase small subunit
VTSDKRAIVVDDPWGQLRQYTPARIALGRAGTSLPTKPHLEFQLAHARARDAVHHELDAAPLQQALETIGYPTLLLQSSADSRPVYLQRPDKGRRLDQASRSALEGLPKPAKPYDAAFVIGDGLSTLAIQENAFPFLEIMLPSLAASGWHLAPLSIVKQARVAIGDEIGELLGARLVVILIGERPGLSSPDSMGIYMTFNPSVGLTDETRNCISNIRTEGLSYQQAAHKLTYLITEARRRGLSGVNLKDEAEALAEAGPAPAGNFLIE